LLTTEIDNENTFFHLENAYHMLKLVSSFSQILLGLKPVLKLMKLLNILKAETICRMLRHLLPKC
jgi:hypothetical protein